MATISDIAVVIIIGLVTIVVAQADDWPVPIRTIKIKPIPADAALPPFAIIYQPPHPKADYAPPDPPRNEMERRVLPPPEFDHPYEGRMVVMQMDLESVTGMCKSVKPRPGSRGFAGCSHIYGDHCDVYIVHNRVLEQSGMTYDAVLRHERAHCNNWRHEQEYRGQK